MGAEHAVQRQAALDDLQSLVRQIKQALVAPDAPGGGLILRATLDAVQQLLALRSRWRADAVLPEVAKAEKEVTAARQRLLDLVDRASDTETMQELSALAEQSGLNDVHHAEQYHAGDQLVGWRVTMAKI
jgi:hypothetical protein